MVELESWLESRSLMLLLKGWYVAKKDYLVFNKIWKAIFLERKSIVRCHEKFGLKTFGLSKDVE